MKRSEFIIFFTVVFAQFCGTSLWFAGNASMHAMQSQWTDGAAGYLTIAVQLGFIVGTLLFSVSGIIDRYSPSMIFFSSCIAGSCCNAMLLFDVSSFSLALSSRVLVGICLAGIYPVGMKIAADWQEKGLGNWLGALVGALVLGTAFPHGLKTLPGFINANVLLISVSALAIIGGVMMLILVPDGPFRKRSPAFSFQGVREAFRIDNFRRPALGYFGHMWEVYAFWAFVPWAVTYYKLSHPELTVNTSLLAFIFIAAGALGCWIGGKLSAKTGSEPIAFYMLLVSGVCCAISPWIWQVDSTLFIIVMIIWGFTAAADSPQFSTLVARAAPETVRGSSITLITCIGFTITIVSIQLLNVLQEYAGDYLMMVLLPGPVLGLIAMGRATRR
jgi:MFS family permease